MKRHRTARSAIRGGVTGAEDKSKGVAPERRMIEAAQRDPACFAQLCENNFERVYAFIARRVHDRDQAQDLTADVFQSALKNLARFEWRGAPFAAWLFRIAANAIADRGKRAAQLEAIKLREIPQQDLSSDADLAEIEHRARLFKLVEKLPNDQRPRDYHAFRTSKKYRGDCQEHRA